MSFHPPKHSEQERRIPKYEDERLNRTIWQHSVEHYLPGFFDIAAGASRLILDALLRIWIIIVNHP